MRDYINQMTDFVNALSVTDDENSARIDELMQDIVRDWNQRYANIGVINTAMDSFNMDSTATTADVNYWLSQPSASGVKRLTGSGTLSESVHVPANTLVDMTGAQLKFTCRVGIYLDGDNAQVVGGTIRMPGNYVSNASVTEIGVWAKATNNGCANMTVLGAAGCGIYGYTANGFKVLNNTVKGPGVPTIKNGDGTCYGILIADGVDPLIHGNSISDTCQGIATASNITGASIQANTILNIQGQHGMYLHNITNGRIIGNRVANTYFNGIKCQIDSSVTADVYDFVFTDNIVNNSGQGVDGIVMSNTDANNGDVVYYGGVVANNIVTNAGRGYTFGSMRYCQIRNNIAYNLTNIGVQVMDLQHCDVEVIAYECASNGLLVNNTASMPSGTHGPKANSHVRFTGRITNCGDKAAGGFSVLSSWGDNLTFENLKITSTKANILVGIRFYPNMDQTTLRVRHCRVNGINTGYQLNSATQTVAEWVDNLGTITNYPLTRVVPVLMRGNMTCYTNNAIPTQGTFVRGDTVFNTAPAPGGAPSWICTTGGGAYMSDWQVGTVYNTDDQVRLPSTGRILKCIVGGTSGGAEPIVPTPFVVGTNIADNTVTWTVLAATGAVFKGSGTIST